jgi:hypothetical protein
MRRRIKMFQRNGTGMTRAVAIVFFFSPQPNLFIQHRGQKSNAQTAIILAAE